MKKYRRTRKSALRARRTGSTFMARSLVHEGVEGGRGNREVHPPPRRGSMGETWFPPWERASGERHSSRVFEHELCAAEDDAVIWFEPGAFDALAIHLHSVGRA